MRMLAFLFTMFFALHVIAQVPPKLSQSVGTPIALNTGSTNVTSSAWVELDSALDNACSGILVHNPGSQPLKLGVGAAAAEVDLGLVLPIGVSILVPTRLSKNQRLAIRSMGSTQSSGVVTISCFQ